MKKAFVVAKREFIQTVRKRSFWVSMLIFPLFLAIILYSTTSQRADRKAISSPLSVEKSVLIVDPGSYIDPSLFQNPYQKVADLADAKKQLINQGAVAVFYYPSNLNAAIPIQVYTVDSDQKAFEIAASALLNKSIALTLQDQTRRELFLNPPSVEFTTLASGEENKNIGITRALAMGIMFFYIGLISLSAGTLLASFAEEKENKVMEIIHTVITPTSFIFGKLLAHIAVLIIQLLFMMALSLGVFHFFDSSITASLRDFIANFDGWTIVKIIFYLGCGYLILANFIIGIGAALPTMRESQKFLSYFIVIVSDI